MSRTYRATFRSTYGDGTLVQPSLHYQTDLNTGGSEPDPSDVAGEIWAHLDDNILTAWPAIVTLHELVVTEQVVPPAIGAVGAIQINQPGLLPVSAEDLPRELVGIINIHSGAATRSGRGYFTLPGAGSELYTSARQWTQAYFNQAIALAALFDDSLSIGAVLPAAIHPVVYSRKRHRAGLTPYTFRVQTATFNVRPHWRRSRGTTP